MYITGDSVLLVWQKEVADSAELHSSLESSVTQLQQNVKERDVDCSKMMLEMQVSCTPVSYTHLRAHETPEHLVCRLLLEKKK